MGRVKKRGALMDVQMMEDAIRGFRQDNLSFASYIDKIKEAGCIAYATEFTHFTTNYFGNTLEVIQKNLPFTYPSIKERPFDPQELQKTFEQFTQEKIDYPNFVKKIIEAGVTHYKVELNPLRCSFYGNQGVFEVKFDLKIKGLL